MDKNYQSQQSSSSKYMDFKVYADVNHIKHRNLQKSNTLMRNSVKNPLGSNVSINTVSGNISTNDQPQKEDPQEYESKLDGYVHNRHPRNYKIPRSELISRFSSTANTQTEDQPQQVFSTNSSLVLTDQNLEFSNTSKIETDNQESVPNSLDNTPQLAKNIFEEALRTTPIPEQAMYLKYSKPLKSKHKKQKNHKFSVLVSSLSVLAIALIIGGIYLGHNLNKVSLYLAASRAGFSPTVSSYNPSGFNLSTVSSASGIVESTFKSNSDSRTYSIIEKKSNWNSSDLLNNYVINRAGLNYQTITQNNLTIYTYNGNSLATWTHNGIWYIVQDNNSLSVQQIIEIATTM